MVSEKHAGFIVNAGGASSGDVLRLIQRIQQTVKEQTGVELEPEVRLI
jgi:UDP-N-acetylmuramate dehydrogenase